MAATFDSQVVYETLLDSVTDAAVVVDSDWRVRYVNMQARLESGATADRATEGKPVAVDSAGFENSTTVGETLCGTELTAVLEALCPSEDVRVSLEADLEAVFDGRDPESKRREYTLSPVSEDGMVTALAIVFHSSRLSGHGRDRTLRSEPDAIAETVDWEIDAEAVLERLYRISASSKPFEQKVTELLSVGREYMSVEQGFFTRIDGETQRIIAAAGPNEQLQTDATAPFSESYCRHTVDVDGPQVILDAQAEGWEADLAYQRFGLACYIGTTVVVDGAVYGTVCFADRSPREQAVSETAKTFVELLSLWLSYELERRQRERDLERSEQRYRTLAENLPNGAMFMFDDALCYQVARGQGLEATPFEATEIEGSTVSELFDGERRDRLVDIYERTLRGESVSFEFDFSGDVYQANTAPVRDHDGSVFAGMAITQDITERTERNAELQRQEQLLENASDTVLLLDEAGIVRYQSHRSEHLEGPLGYDLLGKHFSRYLHPDEREQAQARFEWLLENPGECLVIEHRFATHDGWRWYETRTQNFLDESTIGGVLVSSRDVTDRKHSERKLETTTRQLEAVLDTISAAVFMKDADSQYLLMNQQCRELLGVDPDRAVTGLTDQELFPDDVATQFRADDTTVFEDGRTLEVEETVPTPDGPVPHLTRKSPVFDGEEVIALCAVATDISDQKRRQRELEQFAYVASHDLREPLRVISNYLQLFERRYGEGIDGEAGEYIEYALEATDRMNALIEGLLAYARVGQQDGAFDAVALEAVLADAMANLRIAIEQSDATVSVGELPVVVGNHDQLVTVFQNLLDNAVTYAGDEPPTVEINAEQVASRWRITVADDGIGMEPDDTERVLEIFERLHRDDDGTGLGLALCEKIVDHHGGQLWIDAEPDTGTTVSFTLPTPTEESV